jgi:hypothetical protein
MFTGEFVILRVKVHALAFSNETHMQMLCKKKNNRKK